MANLTSVNINGALIRKEGTTTSELMGATMFPAAHQSVGADVFQMTIAVDPNNANKFAVAYRDTDNSNYGTVRIGTVQSNNTIVWGTASVFNSDITDRCSIAWDYNSSTSYIVVTFAEQNNSWKASARVGTVSGTSISGWGTKKEIAAASPNHQNSYSYLAFDPNTNGKFVISEDQHLSVCTHNGTTITQGTIVTTGAVSNGPVIWDPNDSTKFITAYKLNSNGNIKARVGQVSGTTITLQAEASVNTDSCEFVALDADSNNANRFIVSYDDNDKSNTYVNILTVSGSAGSWTIGVGPDGTVTGSTESTGIFFTNTANKFIVTYRDIGNSNHGTLREGTINYNANPPEITSFGTATVFNSGDTRMAIQEHSAHDKNTNKFVIAYNTAGTDGVVKVGVAKQNKITVDLSTGNYFEVDLQPASDTIDTFTITEALSGTQAQTFYLKTTQGSTARQFNWSGLTHIKWPGSSGPTLSTGNDAVDIFRFTTYDQGTTWNGETIGLNFS